MAHSEHAFSPILKKLINFKIIFVVITSTIKSIEWLGIDSGMLKLIEKIANHFFYGLYTQCLSPRLKIGTFPHIMLDRVWIQTKIINSDY